MEDWFARIIKIQKIRWKRPPILTFAIFDVDLAAASMSSGEKIHVNNSPWNTNNKHCQVFFLFTE
jgi:hypothetical protein